MMMMELVVRGMGVVKHTRENEANIKKIRYVLRV